LLSLRPCAGSASVLAIEPRGSLGQRLEHQTATVWPSSSRNGVSWLRTSSTPRAPTLSVSARRTPVEEAGVVDAELAHRGVDRVISAACSTGISIASLEAGCRIRRIQQQFARRALRAPRNPADRGVFQVQVDDAGMTAGAEPASSPARSTPTAHRQHLRPPLQLSWLSRVPARASTRGLWAISNRAARRSPRRHCRSRPRSREGAHEHVHPAGGALRVGPRGNPVGSRRRSASSAM